VSIAVNPLLYGLTQARRNRASNELLASPTSESEPPLDASAGESTAVIVGHGPTGKILADILRDNHVQPVVVDLNIETIHRLRDEGTTGVYGDAAKAEVLEEAGIARAAAMFLTSASLEGASEVIRVAKQLNPHVRIYVRTDYMSNVAALDRAGAGKVISAEGEVAIAMATTLLEDLGATPDQIDRERDRVHSDLRKHGGLEPSETLTLHSRRTHP
jgi:CPA2 family monovalent cation:H+ antiporter-2